MARTLKGMVKYGDSVNVKLNRIEAKAVSANSKKVKMTTDEAEEMRKRIFSL